MKIANIIQILLEASSESQAVWQSNKNITWETKSFIFFSPFY